MDKQKKAKGEGKLKKVLGTSLLLLFMLPGVYFAGIRYIGSKNIALFLLGAAALAIVTVAVLSLVLAKKGKQAGFLKVITLALVVVLILANVGTLISPYFVAHKTTTIVNRYYPDSLGYMATLQRVTKDKTVWVDASNDYLSSDSKKDTATDYSNRAAVHYACSEIKVLNPSPGVITPAQEDWLKAKEGKYNVLVMKYDKDMKHDREESVYLYKGIKVSEYSDIVLLVSASGDAYWIPMAIYEEMMGEVDA